MDRISIAKEHPGMVAIPGGVFTMGSEQGYAEERPLRRITVAPFYLDQNLVTNREYRAFCDQTGRKYPADPRW